MIDQNNNFHDKKRFGPRISNTHKVHIIPRNTKTFTVETSQINLNTPKTTDIQNIDGKIEPKKKLVFVRKGTGGTVHGRQHQHSSNYPKNNSKNGPTTMRKVTSESALKREQVIPPLTPGNIRIVPLGGVEEVGKNMTAIEYGDDIIVIDSGIQFKTEDTPGIDYMLPNTKYLETRKGKIRALVVTHGHLDHIGGIPFTMEALGNPPIYTREFGALLIKKRQTEYPHLPELNLKIVDKNTDFLPITQNLKIKFFGITHSIPDSTGVVIATPIGDIVATGDDRVDSVDGVPTAEEFEQYKFLKDRKILLLMMDSTGVEKPGWTISEDVVINTIDKIVKDVPGRIVIATFASQVERIIKFINMAEKYGKKLVIEGRSMKNNVEVIKFLKLADGKNIIPVESIADYPPHKIMVLSTGAQGEEFAALMRISNNTHKYIKLNKSDTVILSSSIIPGNERAVVALKDNLYRHDSKIITYLDSDVHAGGHGKRGELEWIHRQIPYKFFMPVHGNHYMLKINGELSASIGTPRENIIVPDNGSIVEIVDNGAKIKVLKEKAPSGIVMVDGFSIGDVQEVVIRDRQMLAQDGMFVIIASIDTATGKLRKSPDIISRGFVYLRESQDLLKHTRFLIKKTVEEGAHGNPINFDMLKEQITDNVSRYLFQQTAKKPMVIPVVIGV
ncbi:MAG: ribonuclease J [Candidatus Taylorbacteria bacterium]|nr:ribonuclease J [Candidatus Taylorbacteria bacterium]